VCAHPFTGLAYIPDRSCLPPFLHSRPSTLVQQLPPSPEHRRRPPAPAHRSLGAAGQGQQRHHTSTLPTPHPGPASHGSTLPALCRPAPWLSAQSASGRQGCHRRPTCCCAAAADALLRLPAAAAAGAQLLGGSGQEEGVTPVARHGHARHRGSVHTRCERRAMVLGEDGPPEQCSDCLCPG
jgi:hypothetical protein